MYNKYPKGSEWRKWDLHTHTPIDHEWINKSNLDKEKGKQLFAKDYIEFAHKQELSLIAITDHNFCYNYEDLLIPYIQEEASKYEITILPGFEITVSDGSGIHVLIIFPKNTGLNDIFELVKQLFPAGAQRIDAEGRIISSNKTLKEIKECIDEAGMEAIFIFAHADSSKGVLKERGGDNKIRLWQTEFVRIAQLSKAKDEYSNNCFEYNVINGRDSNYKKNMTYIVASDCRTIDESIEIEGRFKLGEKFTWVKADPTFEGLKQIIYEPDERVRIQEIKPEDKNPYLIIDRVRFRDNTNKKIFSEDWIELNPNLNTIIGGKSTGKSLLLYHIARTIDPEIVDDATSNFGIKYDKFNVDFEVFWKDGRIDKLSEIENKERRITYIPQLYINRLAEPGGDNREKLNALIKEILLENDDYKDFYNNIQNDIKVIKTDINKEISNLFNLFDEIDDKKKELKAFGDKEAVITEIRRIKNEINSLKEKSRFTEEEVKKYEELIKARETKEKEISYLDNLINNLDEFKKYIDDKFIEIKKEIKDKVSEFKLDFDAEKDQAVVLFDDIYKSIYKELENVKEETISKVDIAKNEKEGIQKTISKELSKIKKELNPLLKKFKNQGLLEKLQKDLKQQQILLKQIENKEKEINISMQKKDKTKDILLEAYGKLMNYYIKIKEELKKENYKNIADNIKLNVELKFNNKKFDEFFTNIFDKRSNLEEIFDGFNEKNQFEFIEDIYLVNVKNIFESLLESNNIKLRIRAGYSKKDAVTRLLGDYFVIKYDLIQNGDKIMNMSPGKRGLILLKLYLELSNAQHPILIDQPEDNLDNRTIYNELNTFIRDKKAERQIIIVTHNANLVVSADAEEVIVANQNGQQEGENREYRFEYVTGALECSFSKDEAKGILYKKGIREHACEILEGGQTAFENREKKYGFRKE
jgi:hypothetical protein